jgi:hypothetical protein
MPIVAAPLITRPEHVIEFISDYLANSSLPLAYVAKYDEPIIPTYPAALVMSGGFQKEIHATHTWLLTLRAEIYVMHAKMTVDRATRNYEDLVLATQIVEYLERDLTLGGKIIAGWVESETPGAMPPRNAKGSAVVSTRLLWAGTTEARF